MTYRRLLAPAPIVVTVVASASLLVLAVLPVMAYVLPLSELLRRVGLLDTMPGIIAAQAAANVLLRVEGLRKEIGDSDILVDINFELQPADSAEKPIRFAMSVTLRN